MDKPIFTARQFLDYLGNRVRLPDPSPPSALLLYSRSLYKNLRTKYPSAKEYRGLGLNVLQLDEHRLVALAAGVGAPAAVMTLELLSALGVRRLIQLGTAGALGTEFPEGRIVVCEKAWRGEGTSAYYEAQSEWAEGDLPLCRSTQKWLEAAGEEVNIVNSWTTDAPYRERPSDIRRFLDLGAKAVEMETSAVYSFATFNGAMQAASVFVISDHLTDKGWQPHFHVEEVKAALERAAEILIKNLPFND